MPAAYWTRFANPDHGRICGLFYIFAGYVIILLKIYGTISTKRGDLEWENKKMLMKV